MTGQIRVPSGGEQPAGATPAGGHADAGRHPQAGQGDQPGSAGAVQVDEDEAVQVDEAAAGTVQVSADELAALRSQLEERTGDLQRITAEYSNYRRRVERDRQAVIASAKAQVAGELLTVLDDIERAEAHGDLSGAFKVVADKLVAGLTVQGLEAYGTTGDEFDPDVHEAVQHNTSPDVQGPTVTAVLRRGYRFGERVLRPAMVAVTDAEPSAEPAADPEALSRDAARSAPGTGAPGDAGRPVSGDTGEPAGGDSGGRFGGNLGGNGGPPGGPAGGSGPGRER